MTIHTPHKRSYKSLFGLVTVSIVIILFVYAPNNRIKTLNSQSQSLYLAGQYKAALRKANFALWHHRFLMHRDGVDLAATHFQYGQACRILGDFKCAKQHYAEARNSLSGFTDNSALQLKAKILHGTGELAYDEGHYDNAEFEYNRALEIQKQLFGEEHEDIALTYNDLGVLYFVQSRFKESDRFYRKSLSLRKKLFGSKHVDVAQSLSNMAVLYTQMGWVKDARNFYAESLAMREELLPKDHPDIGYSLYGLASINYSERNYDEALEQFERILPIWKKSLGHEHKDVAHVLNNMGVIHLSKKNVPLAKQLITEALTIRRKTLSNSHPDLAGNLSSLADLLIVEQHYQEALPHLVESLIIYQKNFWQGHSEVIKIQRQLAMVFAALNEPGLAIALYEELLKHQLQSAQPDIFAQLDILQTLAALNTRIGFFDHALEFDQRFVDNAKRNLPKQAQQMFDIQFRIADNLRRLEKFRELEIHYRNLLSEIHTHDELSNTMKIKIHRDLGLALMDQNKFNEARSWFKKGQKLKSTQIEFFHAIFSMLIGESYLRESKFNDARQNFRNAISRFDLDSARHQVFILQSEFKIALAEYHLGKPDRAIVEVLRILGELNNIAGEINTDSLSPVLVLWLHYAKTNNHAQKELAQDLLIKLLLNMKDTQPQMFEEYLRFGRLTSTILLGDSRLFDELLANFIARGFFSI